MSTSRKRCLSQVFAIVLFLLIPLTAPAAGASETLESSQAVAVIDESGRLADLHGNDAEGLVRAPVTVIVSDALTGKSFLIGERAPTIERTGEAITVRCPAKKLKLDLEQVFELDASLRWTIHLRNRSKRRREVMIEFVFKLDAREASPFFATQGAHPDWPDRGKLAYGYYRWDEGVRWGLPVASVYSMKRDVGLGLCPELAGHIRPITCLMERKGDVVTMRIRRRFIRIEPEGSAQSILYLTPHPGDWRSALSWVRDRWKDLFFVEFPEVERLHYPACAGVGPAAALEGTAPYVGEIQHTKWYGEDIPEEEEWYSRVHTMWWNMKKDDYPGLPDEDAGHLAIQQWLLDHKVPEKYAGTRTAKQIEGFEFSDGPDHMTRELINRHIDHLHEADFKVCWYYCPMEAWGAYMKKVWPGGLVYGGQQFFPPSWPDEDSLATPQYYNWGSYVTNPDPDTPFGRHLVKQVETLFTSYPEIDGIYIDQPFHVELDFSRDDGISTVEGRPVSNTGYGFDKLMQRIQEIAHNKGKFIWCNIPVDIAQARWMDVMQQESRGPSAMERQKFHSIGDRISLTLFPSSEVTFFDGTSNNEYFNHVALAAGFIQRLHSNYEGQRRALEDLAEGKRHNSFTFQYLFAMLRGRSWVLEPHCLELPPSCTGNIFRTKAGNILAPVILRDTTTTTPHMRYDLPVTVRVKDAADVRAAYLVSWDHLGPKKLPFEREGDKISVIIPRQRSVSMLLLATTGRYVALDSVAIDRGTPQLRLALDNWTDTPWHFRGTFTGLVSSSIDRDLSPGESVRVQLPCDWTKTPANENDLRVFLLETETHSSIPEVRLPGDPATEPFEVFVDDPLVLDVAAPLSVRADERTTLGVTVANHSANAVSVALLFKGPDVHFEAPASIALDAGERRIVPVTFEAKNPGNRRLTVAAQAGDASAEAARVVIVERTGVAEGDLAHIGAAWVTLDTFSQDMGGAKPWTLSINGVEAAKIRGDSAGGNHGMWRSQIPQSGRFDLTTRAIKALKRVNEVRISNPNRDASPYPIAYGFKVRDLTLHLGIEDGTELNIEAGGRVLTSNGDWLYAEGVRAALDEDIVWEIVIPRGPASDIPDLGRNLATRAKAVDVGSLFAGNRGKLGGTDPRKVGVAALNDGDADTRVVAASGYHRWALVFEKPVTFDTLLLKEYGNRIKAVEIRMGADADSMKAIHPDPPDVRNNWYQAPYGEKVHDRIIITTGRRTARRIEVNLYRAHSTSVSPPSVSEMELYLTGR